MSAGWTVPQTAAAECVLCHDTEAVRTGLMRFRDQDAEGRVFSHGPRCIDHRACRERYEALTGERYPLEEPR